MNDWFPGRKMLRAKAARFDGNGNRRKVRASLAQGLAKSV